MERALGVDRKFAAARGQIAFLHSLALLQGDSNDPNWLYKGEEEARRALDDDPGAFVALSALAGIYYLQGRIELVPAVVERALAVNPNDPGTRMWLSLRKWANGEYESVILRLREILALEPLFWPARMNLGEVLREQGDRKR